MVKEIPAQNCRYLIQNRKEGELPATLSPATALEIRAFHRQLPGDYLAREISIHGVMADSS